MAIIKCSECERNISDKAQNCPHCGFPLKNNDEIHSVSNIKPYLMIMTVILVIIGAVVIVFLKYNRSDDHTSVLAH